MPINELYTHAVNTYELGQIPEDKVEAVDRLIEPHGLGLVAIRGPGIGLNLAHMTEEARDVLLQQIHALGLSVALNAVAHSHPDHHRQAAEAEWTT